MDKSKRQEEFTYQIEEFFPDNDVQSKTTSSELFYPDVSTTDAKSECSIILDQNASHLVLTKELNALDNSVEDNNIDQSPIIPLQKNCYLSPSNSIRSSGSTSIISESIADDKTYYETFSGFDSSSTSNVNDYSLDFEDSGSEYVPSLHELNLSNLEVSSDDEDYKVKNIRNTYLGRQKTLFSCNSKDESTLPNVENNMEDSQLLLSRKVKLNSLWSFTIQKHYFTCRFQTNWSRQENYPPK